MRVAGLKAQTRSSAARTACQTPCVVTLGRAARAAPVARQYELFNDEILPGLKEEGIRFLRRSHVIAAQRDWIKHYFTAK